MKLTKVFLTLPETSVCAITPWQSVFTLKQIALGNSEDDLSKCILGGTNWLYQLKEIVNTGCYAL